MQSPDAMHISWGKSSISVMKSFLFCFAFVISYDVFLAYYFTSSMFWVFFLRVFMLSSYEHITELIFIFTSILHGWKPVTQLHMTYRRRKKLHFFRDDGGAGALFCAPRLIFVSVDLSVFISSLYWKVFKEDWMKSK